MTYVLTTLHKSSKLDSSKLGLNTAVCMHLPVFALKIKLRAVTVILIEVVNSSLGRTPFTPTTVTCNYFAIWFQSIYKYILEDLLQVFSL